MDEAAASLRLEITSKPQALDELDRRILQLDMERVSVSKSSGVLTFKAPLITTLLLWQIELCLLLCEMLCLVLYLWHTWDQSWCCGGSKSRDYVLHTIALMSEEPGACFQVRA